MAKKLMVPELFVDKGQPVEGLLVDVLQPPSYDPGLDVDVSEVADAWNLPAGYTKHLQGRHNQLSHGRGGGAQMSPDAGGSSGGREKRTTPATEQEKELENYVEMISRMQKDNTEGRDMKYGGTEHIVQELGQFDEAQPRPAGIKQGRMKECFKNAFDLMQDEPDEYTYVEGVAFPKGLIPVNHAWCVDRSGKVVDPTWKDSETTAYKGVHLSSEFVTQTVLSKGSYEVFDYMSKEGRNMIMNGLPKGAVAD